MLNGKFHLVNFTGKLLMHLSILVLSWKQLFNINETSPFTFVKKKHNVNTPDIGI